MHAVVFSNFGVKHGLRYTDKPQHRALPTYLTVPRRNPTRPTIKHTKAYAPPRLHHTLTEEGPNQGQSARPRNKTTEKIDPNGSSQPNHG